MRGAGFPKGAGWLYAVSGLILLAVLIFSVRWAQGPQGRPAVTPVARPPVAQPVRQPATQPVFPPGKGRIAIVLDDWGYSLKQMEGILSIREPLTLAVLPDLPHSAEVARQAAAHGHEVILHMPMEANDPRAPREAGTLMTGMPTPEVLDLLGRSLAGLPGVRGVSNHQGSRATLDPALMETVLREVKRRNLYFLDSFVTQGSVCREVARRVRVRFAQRAVFLDNEDAPQHIRQQLEQLARSASRNGGAIGIGHDRPATVEMLRQAVPALEKAGYTLVTVSDLTE